MTTALTTIKELHAMQKDINIGKLIVLQKEGVKTVKGEVLHTFLVADETAAIHLCLWGDMGLHPRPGEIYELRLGYTSLWNGSLLLYMGKGGRLSRTGEFCMLFTETPNMSEVSGGGTNAIANATVIH